MFARRPQAQSAGRPFVPASAGASWARRRGRVWRCGRAIATWRQLIDDVHGKILVSASTLEKTVSRVAPDGNVAAAKAEVAGRAAPEMKIEQVVFDRGGFLYGR